MTATGSTYSISFSIRLNLLQCNQLARELVSGLGHNAGHATSPCEASEQAGARTATHTHTHTQHGVPIHPLATLAQQFKLGNVTAPSPEDFLPSWGCRYCCRLWSCTSTRTSPSTNTGATASCRTTASTGTSTGTSPGTSTGTSASCAWLSRSDGGPREQGRHVLCVQRCAWPSTSL